MMKNYDRIDLRNARNTGFYQGAIAGCIGCFLMCLFLGLYVVGYIH